MNDKTGRPSRREDDKKRLQRTLEVSNIIREPVELPKCPAVENEAAFYELVREDRTIVLGARGAAETRQNAANRLVDRYRLRINALSRLGDFGAVHGTLVGYNSIMKFVIEAAGLEKSFDILEVDARQRKRMEETARGLQRNPPQLPPVAAGEPEPAPLDELTASSANADGAESQVVSRLSLRAEECLHVPVAARPRRTISAPPRLIDAQPIRGRNAALNGLLRGLKEHFARSPFAEGRSGKGRHGEERRD